MDRDEDLRLTRMLAGLPKRRPGPGFDARVLAAVRARREVPAWAPRVLNASLSAALLWGGSLAWLASRRAASTGWLGALRLALHPAEPLRALALRLAADG